MESVIFAVRFLALSQVLILLISLASSDNPPRVRLTGAALSIGIICYLLGSTAKLNGNIDIASLLFFFASLTPLSMLLFVWLGFEDQHTLPNWVWLMVAVYICAEAASLFHYALTDNTYSYLTIPMQVIQLSLAIGALYLLWKGKEYDLVEARTKLRTWGIYCTAILIFSICIVLLVTAHEMPKELDLVFTLATFLLALAINIAILKFNPDAQISTHGKPKIIANQDQQIRALLERMQSERLYADHDIRVAKLAKLIGLPEHRLRKKINQQLGYRNFNQFVNHYRIEEAGKRLHQEPTTPVLSLALDVGFRSISSFNTAFQLQYRMSPTAYRQQVLHSG